MPTTQSRWKWIGLLILVVSLGWHHDKDATDAPPAPDTASGGTGPHIVMIIRHGEKPDDDKDANLATQGYERAKALATVIPAHFPKPDFLIATKPSKGSSRPLETITPLSEALHEKIEDNYSDDEFASVAHEVMNDPKFDGKVVLIAWHHGKIPDLARALGVKDAPDKWNSAEFDRVWEITFKNGTGTFANLPQEALAGDSKK